VQSSPLIAVSIPDQAISLIEKASQAVPVTGNSRVVKDEYCDKPHQSRWETIHPKRE
jgi:hypothetical protein